MYINTYVCMYRHRERRMACANLYGMYGLVKYIKIKTITEGKTDNRRGRNMMRNKILIYVLSFS